MSIDTQPQEKTHIEWFNALRCRKHGMEKRRAAALLRSQLTVRSQGLHKANKAAAYSFFLHFLLRSQQYHLESQTGNFPRKSLLRGCARTFANAASAKMRRRPGKQPQFIRSQHLFIPLTAYSPSRSHHCASERGATRRRTSARGGRKPAASPRRLRGRCSPRAAGAGFRR